MPAAAYEDCKCWVSALESQEEARADLGLQEDVGAFQEKRQEFGESSCKLKRTIKKQEHMKAPEAGILVYSHQHICSCKSRIP